ncbi:hypothetical protein BAY61_12590 [Prauserella marina]|uniref:Uncharacterized protein n=1 Tax=Prauserella marina TaxID=530584 RepID=A0A222VPC5_9PSEU|nr:hypothetical protein [Prauserella marina]ASR35702.1 hypothetical protein BAY61_12590 [Prauserella marina]PWV84421.1 hypothetical protein DES30_101438 [Prauserella marina]SDC22976.1 hypothetical protein SAMN05421630_101899 [Prauserella marina]
MAWRHQPRDNKGRFASKTGVAAVVTASVVAFGATTGGVGGGTGPLGTGAGTGKNLVARKAESKKSARAGRADEAWHRLGLRTVRKATRQHTDCVRHSFGEVREFLIRNPCASLKRTLFAVGEGKDSVVVSVAWVEFRTRARAVKFRELIDVHGTGDIAPLAGGLVGAADVRFTGHNYDSRLNRAVLTVAETEPLSGEFSGEDLDTAAEVAALLPRP